jgi:hypothetical protein
LLFVDTLNPVLIEESTKGAVESARAEFDATAADSFNVFENGVTVPGLLRKTQQHQQYRFAQRQCFHNMSSTDMSYNAILNLYRIAVKRELASMWFPNSAISSKPSEALTLRTHWRISENGSELAKYPKNAHSS